MAVTWKGFLLVTPKEHIKKKLPQKEVYDCASHLVNRGSTKKSPNNRTLPGAYCSEFSFSALILNNMRGILINNLGPLSGFQLQTEFWEWVQKTIKRRIINKKDRKKGEVGHMDDSEEKKDEVKAKKKFKRTLTTSFPMKLMYRYYSTYYMWLWWC